MPLVSVTSYDDTGDNELSTYKSKKKNKEEPEHTSSSSNVDEIPERETEHDIFTEATVTSPPLTTVINGFVLPQTVRNFFKRPTINPLQDNGIETVRTSEKKQIEKENSKHTTKEENSEVFESKTEGSGDITKIFEDTTVKPFFIMPTTQPIRVAIENNDEQVMEKDVLEVNLQPVDEKSSVTISDATTLGGKADKEVYTGTTVTPYLIEDEVTVKESVNNSSAGSSSFVKDGETTTEALFSNKIEEIDIARNSINMTDVTTTRNFAELSNEKLSNEAGEVPVTESKDATNLEEAKESGIQDSKSEKTDSDSIQIKKEEKRPASTSPVSELLNGIYRLISVRKLCYFVSNIGFNLSNQPCSQLYVLKN